MTVDLDQRFGHQPRPGRWNVMVTSHGVRGCYRSCRWGWLARHHERAVRRFWPDPNAVVEVWSPARGVPTEEA